MIPKDEIRKGRDLRRARKESGLHQADMASMLRPPIDVHIVAAWEQALAQPTESQRIQLQALFRRRLPKTLQSVEPKPPKFDRSAPWSRGLGSQGLRQL
jgi:ribosome-binding protein aMBF1 (putative translation factor)